ncbi:hypothetical protein K492DRAFT_203011, partial [Lichtheimia hyalospora FSU 10163]
MDSNQSCGSSDNMAQAVMWQQVPTSKADTMIDDFEMIDEQKQPQTTERSFLLSSNASEYYSDYADTSSNFFGPASTFPTTLLQTHIRPICFRVLFMGNTESIGNINRSKTLVLRKLSEVIASLLPRSSTSSTSNDLGTTDFREKTHNVVFLDAFDTSPIETYEDNGLHVIEADFTDNNNNDDQYERRLMDYVNTHDWTNAYLAFIGVFFNPRRTT